MDTVHLDHKLLGILSNLFSALKNESKMNNEDKTALASLIANNSFHILLVDDDEDDRDIFKEAIEEIAPSVKITTATNGVEMFLMLEKLNNDLPDLIFLDLNMPCKNGFECLEELKSAKEWKDVPVFIYSTTSNPEQINRTYHNGANLYIQKPDSYPGIKNILKKILEFDFEDLFLQPERENFVFK